MISVAEAYEKLFALVDPLDTKEEITLEQAAGRVLRKSITAQRDQPPFPASAMDGYAILEADAIPQKKLKVIGESTAGKRFAGSVSAGLAVRIFTGGVVPDGASKILIQEDCTREDDAITIGEKIDTSAYIRPAGGDFNAGFELSAPILLSPERIALAAAMNVPKLTVTKRPRVALIATGDELVYPGETPNPDQIISSNNYGLKALVESHGAIAHLLPIARDNKADLLEVFKLAQEADLIVTLGGASVGEYDLVQTSAKDAGMETAFYKVAMRPGKPLMAGRLNGKPMIGLPGNPVSAMVCGRVFLVPMIEALLGLPKTPPLTQTARLGKDMQANGPRAHYMRATLENGIITPLDRQDSSLLSVLSGAQALLIRDPHAPIASQGEEAAYLVF